MLHPYFKLAYIKLAWGGAEEQAAERRKGNRLAKNWQDEAQKMLDELLELSQQEYVEPYFIALIYTALDEKDQAFTWLEKAYEEHFATMAVLKVDPMFDSLRDDPRFKSLLQRMGLANTEAPG